LWKTTTNQNQRHGAEDRVLFGPITNKMKETLQKQCKGHSMGATMFLVHTVIWLMTRSMCDACNDRNVCWNVLLVTSG